jgi:CDP-archaeol synthase
VVAVALGTAGGFAVQAVVHRHGAAHSLELLDYANPAVVGLGLAVGSAAMLSELPNSLLKRQLRIGPGAVGRRTASVVFYVLDQIDMLIGVWLVLGLVVTLTAARVVASVAFLFAAHQVLTVVGHRLGMRATAR